MPKSSVAGNILSKRRVRKFFSSGPITTRKLTKKQKDEMIHQAINWSPAGVTQILKRMGILRGVQKPVKFAKPVIKGTPEELTVEIVKHGVKVPKGKHVLGFYNPKTNQVAVTSAKEQRKLLGDAREIGMHESLHGYIRRELGIARAKYTDDPSVNEKAFQNIRDLFKGARVSKEWMRGGPESTMPGSVEETVVRNLTRKMLKQPRKKRKLK